MMKRVKRWLKAGRELFKTNRRLRVVSFVLLASVVLMMVFVFVPAPNAQAVDKVAAPATAATGGGLPDVNFVTNWLARGTFMISRLFLSLSLFLLTFIIQLAGYNGFIDSTTVTIGWVMMRDLVNMLFVIFLLIIAFGTILGLEQYEWKKLMVKFVLAAILVNFSRVICGLIIDVAQVVMITFVNGIAATAGGNLINAFSLDNLYSFTPDLSPENLNTLDVMISAVAAVAFTGMLMMTMLSIMVMLLFRVIVLWVLIVLSPLAFVMKVIPKTESYSSQWWKEFGNHVVAGPILLFFVWLSFITLGNGNIDEEITNASVPAGNLSQTDASSVSGAATSGISDLMGWGKMANFAIAIGMLIAGAKLSQQFSVEGGNMMGGVRDFGKKVAATAAGVGLGMWAYNTLKGGASKTGHWGKQKGIDALTDYGSMARSGVNIFKNKTLSKVPGIGTVVNWSARRAKGARTLKDASEKSDKLLAREQSSGWKGDLKRQIEGQLEATEERSKVRDRAGVDEAKLKHLNTERIKDGKGTGKTWGQEAAGYKTEADAAAHNVSGLITGIQATDRERDMAAFAASAQALETAKKNTESAEVHTLRVSIENNDQRQQDREQELVGPERKAGDEFGEQYKILDGQLATQWTEAGEEFTKISNRYVAESSEPDDNLRTKGGDWYLGKTKLEKEKEELLQKLKKTQTGTKAHTGLLEDIQTKNVEIEAFEAKMPEELSTAKQTVERLEQERLTVNSNFTVGKKRLNDEIEKKMAQDPELKSLKIEKKQNQKIIAEAKKTQEASPEFKVADRRRQIMEAYIAENPVAEEKRKTLEKELEEKGLRKQFLKEAKGNNPGKSSEEVSAIADGMFKDEVNRRLGKEFLIEHFKVHPELIGGDLLKKRLDAMVASEMVKHDVGYGVNPGLAGADVKMWEDLHRAVDAEHPDWGADKKKPELWRRYLQASGQAPQTSIKEMGSAIDEEAGRLANEFTTEKVIPGLVGAGARATRAELLDEAAQKRLEAAKGGSKEEALKIPAIRALFEATQKSVVVAEGAQKAVDMVKEEMLQGIYSEGLKDLKTQHEAAQKKHSLELAAARERAKESPDHDVLSAILRKIDEENKILNKKSIGAKTALANVKAGYFAEHTGIAKQEMLDEADDQYSMERYGNHTQSTAMKSLINKKMQEYTGVEREQAVTMAVDNFAHAQAIKESGGELARDQEAMMMAGITFLTKEAWSDDMLAEIVNRIKASNRGELTGEARGQGELLKKLFEDRLQWGGIDGNDPDLNNFVNQSSNKRTNDLHRLIALGGDADLMMSENAVLKHMKDTGKGYGDAFKSLVEKVSDSSKGFGDIAKDLGFEGMRLQNQLRAFTNNFKLGKGVNAEAGWKTYQDKINSHAESYQFLADAKKMALNVAHLDDGGHTYFDMKEKMFRGQDADDAMNFILGDWRKLGSEERMRRLKTHSNGQMNEDSQTIAIDMRNAKALRETYQNVTTEHNFNRQDGRNIDHLAGLAAGEKAVIDPKTGRMIIGGVTSAMQTSTFGHLDTLEKRQEAALRQLADNFAVTMDNAPIALAAALGMRSNMDFDEATAGHFNLMLPEGEAILSNGSREIKTTADMLEFIERYRSGINRKEQGALNRVAIQRAYNSQANRSPGKNDDGQMAA